MLDLALVSTIFAYERARCIGGDAPGGPWDVVVVGAGASALRAARTAIAEGAEVALVRERDGLAREQREWEGASIVGAARFTSSETLVVGGRELRARSFVVATGSVARRPRLPGLAPGQVLTPDELDGVRSVPARVVVLGSGPTGLELGQMFARRGAHVSVVDACPSIGFASATCAVELERLLSREMDIRLGATVVAARTIGEVAELVVHDRAGAERLLADRVLLALGRTPRLEHLELERAGVEFFAGAPIVDRYRRTSNPRIFYAGDGAAEPGRAGLAARDAELAGHNAAHPEAPIAAPDVPPMTIVKTAPPYARVGLGELAARVRFGEIVVASRRFEAGGLMRIWTDRGGKLLGGEVVGPEGDLLVHLLSYAIHFGATAEDIRRAEHGHATLAETLRELADAIARAAACTTSLGGARARSEPPSPAALHHDGAGAERRT